MAEFNILAHCKLLLRLRDTSAFDDEILQLIEVAFFDLKISGVDLVDNKLAQQAVTTYVKANFGHQNPDKDGLMECYQNLKNHLALSKYGEVKTHEETRRTYSTDTDDQRI